MTRRILIAVWAVVAAAAAAGVIWFYAAGNVGDPTEVTAPPITAAVSDPSPAPSDSPPPSDPDTTTSSSPVSEDSEPSPETTAAEEASTDGAGVELQLAEGTEARFLIFEELRGEPFTVVGATAEVVGRVRVDRSELSDSRIGEILINARTFATDSSNRDRAIRGPILSSEQHEFIVFRPTALVGLSGAAEPGSEWMFAVEGDLTVREVTLPVTFEVVARWGPDDLLEGRASTVVSRSEFGLSVPSVPFVANVADEIGLELDFVARPGGLG